MQHLFVLNPKAGGRDRSEELGRTIENLDCREPITVLKTTYAGHATDFVQDFLLKTDDFVRIYACGGDGTLCEVVRGIHASGQHVRCAVGVIPIGSGNDFVRSFEDKLSEDFRDLNAMVRGAYIGADLIEVSDENTCAVSINILSVGYDAAVAKGMQKYKRIPFLNKAAYMLSVLECLVSKMKHRLQFICDGEEIRDESDRYLFGIAANGRYYGGGFKASPLSDIRDGVMDFIRIKTVSRLTFLKLIGVFKRGEHLEKMPQYATHRTCRTLKICADRMLDVNVDGEIIEMHNPTVRLLHDAVQIIVPGVREEATV